ANGGVGEYRHHLRLHLEDAAGHGEVELLAAGQGDDDLAGLEPGDQRRVARRDAELALFAGGHQQLGFAVEDLLLGADDVAAESAHVPAPQAASAILLPFSIASSMVPTM